MSRISIIVILAQAILLIIFSSSYPQESTGSDTLIINSINVKTETGELPAENIDFKDAANWAYNQHLTLQPDNPPLVDNKAFFITQYQTVIPVSGYRRNLFYKIYFDFLRYCQRSIPFNTRLNIFIRDIYGNKRQVGTATVDSMSDKRIFEVSVPFDLSYPGKFDIIIHEYSGKCGTWGIWDIIVSSKKIDEIEIMPIESAEKIKEIEPKIFK